MRLAGRATAIGLTVWAATALFARWVDSTSTTMIAVQATAPWAVIGALIAAIIGQAIRDDRIGSAAGAVVVVGLVTLSPAVFGTDRGTRLADAEPIRVVAANVLFDNEQLGPLIDQLAAIAPDIVVVPEATDEFVAAARRHPLTADLRHTAGRTASMAGGTVVLSRFPITAVTGSANDTVFERVDIAVSTPDGTVRVLAVHPPPPTSLPSLWRTELDDIGRLAADDAVPTIVAGDLNATWSHPGFRAMLGQAGLRDALAAAGHPFAATWPAHGVLPPFLMLDHVLVDDEWAVIDASTAALPGSDHRAVVADIARRDRPD